MKGKIWKRLAAAAMVIAVALGELPTIIRSTGLADSNSLTADALGIAAEASTVFGELNNGLYKLTNKTYTLTSDVKSTGRIYVPGDVTAVVDLNGYTIDRGLTSLTDGGSVFGVAAGGRLTVINGTVCGGARKDANGGGFNVNGELILEGVTVTDCKAKDAGGGIFINGADASATLRGSCYIQYNSAGTYGGGIYVNNDASLNIERKPVVTENTVSNVYLDAGRKINITGELKAGTIVGVTYADKGKDCFTAG